MWCNENVIKSKNCNISGENMKSPYNCKKILDYKTNVIKYEDVI